MDLRGYLGLIYLIPLEQEKSFEGLWGLFGGYLGVIWGLFGGYLGVICGLFAGYLGFFCLIPLQSYSALTRGPSPLQPPQHLAHCRSVQDRAWPSPYWAPLAEGCCRAAEGCCRAVRACTAGTRQHHAGAYEHVAGPSKAVHRRHADGLQRNTAAADLGESVKAAPGRFRTHAALHKQPVP